MIKTHDAYMEVAKLKRELVEAKETLHDRFAMAALTGLLASVTAATAKEFVSAANEIATEMMKARGKK